MVKKKKNLSKALKVIDKNASNKENLPSSYVPGRGLFSPKDTPPNPKDRAIIRDQYGNPSGVQVGKNVFFIPEPERAEEITAREIGKKHALGATDIAQQNVRERLAPQVGQVGEVTPQPTSPDYEQAVKSSLGATASGVVGGAATGAVAGAIGGAGVGAIPGALLGGVAGGIGTFLTSFRSNLKSQTTGELAARKTDVTTLTTNMRNIISDTNANPGNAMQNLELFNTQLTLMEQKQAELKMTTDAELSKFLGEDGTPQLERYELFYAPGGIRDILVAQMQQAILNPDPNQVVFDTDVFTQTEI